MWARLEAGGVLCSAVKGFAAKRYSAYEVCSNRNVRVHRKWPRYRSQGLSCASQEDKKCRKPWQEPKRDGLTQPSSFEGTAYLHSHSREPQSWLRRPSNEDKGEPHGMSTNIYTVMPSERLILSSQVAFACWLETHVQLLVFNDEVHRLYTSSPSNFFRPSQPEDAGQHACFDL